jgi:hypothetical protein
MKIIFRPVLTLSLATLVLLAPSPLRAAADVPSKDTPQSNEGPSLDGPFPLNKHNPIQLNVETVTRAGDKATVRETLNPTFVAGDKALKEVIAHPENANAVELATAAAGALRAGDLEEAGLLIFAARLRGFQDLECYPPTKEGQAISTEASLGMLLSFVKTDVVHLRLQFEPKVFAGVVKRLEAFQLKEPADYKPGWDYVKHIEKDDLFTKNKAAMLAELKPVSDLLLMPDYLAAFKRYCEFNELSPEMQKLPVNAKNRAEDIETMKRIEKEKNLQGVMYQMDHAEAN